MPQAVGQVKILLFSVKIIFIPMYANIFRDAGQVPLLRYFEACMTLVIMIIKVKKYFILELHNHHLKTTIFDQINAHKSTLSSS